MAIQVAQITGDTVELVFNPAEDDLHVGENLSVIERHDERGLIVQIIELKAIFSAPSLSSRSQDGAEGSRSAFPAITAPASSSSRTRKPRRPARKGGGLHLAIAKIRKMTGPAWYPWDGWIPASDVIVTRIADHEMLRHCIPEAKLSLELGQTPAGEPFGIEGTLLETINLIAGAKGSGTSHLAEVLIRELIAHGFPCVVFDTEGTYTLLAQNGESSSVGREGRPAVVHLIAGENLRLGVQHLGLDTLLMMLKQFGLPSAVAMYFESQVTRRLTRSQQQDDTEHYPAFLGIDDLIQLAQDLESDGQVVVGGAILSSLEAIKQTEVLATHAAEATAFWNSFAKIRHGGALVIDLSRLPRRARTGVVQALVTLLRDITKQEIAAESNYLPCLFFDDAQALVTRRFSADLVAPARQPSLTSFFVTTIVTNLQDSLLHEANNLFLLQVASDDDVRHLAKSGLIDPETLRAVVRRLPKYHSMLIGSATGGFPIIFAVDARGEVERTVGRRAFSRTLGAERRGPAARAMARVSTQIEPSAEADLTLPLFPDDTPAPAVASEPREHQRISTGPQPPTPSIAQVTAAWDHIVKRVARRRRILEPILSAARPLRIAGPRLVLGLPPQHRFQQELVESEEYRSLLEEELKKAFGVNLEVTTELHPV